MNSRVNRSRERDYDDNRVGSPVFGHNQYDYSTYNSSREKLADNLPKISLGYKRQSSAGLRDDDIILNETNTRKTTSTLNPMVLPPNMPYMA